MELAVLKVLVETQNEELLAALLPLVPFSVASVDVMAVAALVIGDVAANADGAMAPKEKPSVPSISAEDATTATDVLMRCIIVFFIRMIIDLVRDCVLFAHTHEKRG